MKKQLNPAIVAVIVVVVVAIAGFLFYKGTATPEPVHMDPLGPAAKLLRSGGPGGGVGRTPDVEATQKMMQQQQGGGK